MLRSRFFARYRFILALAIAASMVCGALVYLLHPGEAQGARELTKAKLFGRAATAIERYYYDPHRIDTRKMFKAP